MTTTTKMLRFFRKIDLRPHWFVSRVSIWLSVWVLWRAKSFVLFCVGWENHRQCCFALGWQGTFEKPFLQGCRKLVWSESDLFRRGLRGWQRRSLWEKGCSKHDWLLEQGLELSQYLGCACSCFNFAGCDCTIGASLGLSLFLSFNKVPQNLQNCISHPYIVFSQLLRIRFTASYIPWPIIFAQCS